MLAIVVAVGALGAVIAASVVLWRQSKLLSAQVESTQKRLSPLVEETNEELAVASLEIDAITRRLEQDDRAAKRQVNTYEA